MLSTNNRRLRIAYVGPFEFPEGGACARRVLGIAQSLHQAGHEVVIGSGQRPMLPAVTPISTPFAVFRLGERPARELPRVLKAVRLLTWGGRTLEWLKAWPSPPDAVVAFGGYSPYLMRLLPWTRRMRVPLVIDVVEWFQPSHLPGGRFGPFRLDTELAIQFLYPKAGNIIAISRYLSSYYRGKGCQTIRIPPTLDAKVVSWHPNNGSDGPLTLAYTGDPGKKDLIGNVMEAIIRLDPAGERVRLVIAGPSPEKLLKFAAFESRGLKALPGCVRALGRVTAEQAMGIVRQADYSVLLRTNERYANAGFPTKVVESLACGTPVICNLTSDLGEHIRDSQEGIICRDHSVDACIEAIERAILMPKEERSRMRRCARVQAERAFDYRCYTAALDEFFQKAVKAARCRRG